MANAFRRSPWRVFGLVIALLCGIALAVVIVAALVSARHVADVAVIRSVLVAAGSLSVLGFLLLPLLFGARDALDPRAFSLYGLQNVRLAGGLVIAALISIPSLILIVCSLASVVTWSRNPGVGFVALICAAVAILTCVLAARITTSIAAFLLASRRARELTGMLAVLLVVAVLVFAALLAHVDWANDGLAALAATERWLSWTPLGAIWAIPGDLLLGEWGAALLKLIIALAFLVLLGVIWFALVSVMLVTRQREVHAKGYAGIGWFARVPPGQANAIAARAATYWGRDARYWVGLVIIPIVPALVVVPLLIAGLPAHYLVLLPLPVMCLFLGWTVHNDVALDSTAIWLHVVSGTRGYSDRLGRIFPVLLIGVPLIAVGSVATTWLYGQWSLLLPVIGLSSSVLLIGVGLSSISSVLFPYPATKPGDSAFTQPQVAGGAPAIAQTVSFLAILVLALPAVAFMLLGLFVSPAWLIATAAGGLGIGLAVLAAGIYIGGRVFDHRGPELMAFATRND
jgi:ABC-2 type transport system permease protein